MEDLGCRWAVQLNSLLVLAKLAYSSRRCYAASSDRGCQMEKEAWQRGAECKLGKVDEKILSQSRYHQIFGSERCHPSTSTYSINYDVWCSVPSTEDSPFKEILAQAEC